ncbi:MAG: ABC-type transporter, periplasmic subunit [Firmicutes bacterium]|nr:ABC-type transporter, periplasmic subunit [Bacillota bacterium]
MPTGVRKTITFLLTCFLAIAATGCSSPSQAPPRLRLSSTAASLTTQTPPVTLTNFDANGQPSVYTYQQIPSRVVITHPGATELLLEFGLENRILSTVALYGQPLDRLTEKYAKLPLMQARYAPSQEEMFELQPDMIISWPHHFSDQVFGNIASWQERGVATYILPSALHQDKLTLENTVYASIADIGSIFGITAKTNQYLTDYRTRVARVETAVRGITHKKTVLVLQMQADGKFSLYDSSYLISSLIAIAGGQHIGTTHTSIVGAEQVLAYDPDFILFVSTNPKSNNKDLTDQEAITTLQAISELRSMRAIEQGNIIHLPFFTVNNGGLRTIAALEKIAKTLYPERFNQSKIHLH